MKTLLVTRPQRESEAMSGLLAERGFASIVEPLLTIEYATDDAPLQDALALKPDWILATSRHAVHAMAHRSGMRGVPLAVVGKTTAQQAEAHGFTVGFYAPDVAGLLAASREEMALSSRVLYVRGEEVAADIAAPLAERFRVDCVTLYRAVPAQALSPALQEALRKRFLAGALFLSPRTAKTYVRLVRENGLERQHDSIRAFGMSKSISAALSSLPWRSIHTAQAPDMEHMLRELDQAFETQ